MSLKSINFLHLSFLDTNPDKLFPAARSPAHPDTMGENNTPTALKSCGLKINDFATLVVVPKKGGNKVKYRLTKNPT